MADERTNEGSKVPYVMAYGVITKTLDKIVQAATPSRFTQDFLATKLAVKGGTAKAVIPFLKRVGFLNSDGTPTQLYNEFRNDSLRGSAAAKAVRHGFTNLYEMNEYVHEINDADLKSLIVQLTGAAPTSSTVKSTVGSFKALKAYADFEAVSIDDNTDEQPNTHAADDYVQPEPAGVPQDTHLRQHSTSSQLGGLDLRLGYTINLNLPATTEIAVYDAIFKSIKSHLVE